MQPCIISLKNVYFLNSMWLVVLAVKKYFVLHGTCLREKQLTKSMLLPMGI